MNAPIENKYPMWMSLKLTAINPTERHPRFTEAMRARDQYARDQILTDLLPKPKVEALAPILAFVGLDIEVLIRDGEISWDDAITGADAVEQNLSELGSNENLRKWWLGIAKEWRFSGGLRVRKSGFFE